MKKELKKYLLHLYQYRDFMANKLYTKYDPYFDGFFDALALVCDQLTRITLKYDKEGRCYRK